MKCLKVEEYIKQTGSAEETRRLTQELQKYVRSQLGLQGRTLCDRVIRACNHQLGVGPPDVEHISLLVELVELCLCGYDRCVGAEAQSSPLYMEKILFHIVKKLSSLKVPTLCSHVAALLLSRLPPTLQVQEEHCVLVRSCFSVLWNELSAAKDEKVLHPQKRLCCQLQALSFLLLDMDATASFSSKAPKYTEEAILEFESSCGSVMQEDALFLLQEMHKLFNRTVNCVQGCRGSEAKQHLPTFILFILSEMMLLAVKMLCKAGHHSLAVSFLSEMEVKVSQCVGYPCTPLVLGKWGVKVHSEITSGRQNGQPLTECARVLRSLSVDLSGVGGRALLEACGLVLWAVESRSEKGLSGPVLLAFYSFLEEYQEYILKMLDKTLSKHLDSRRLQQTLCFSIYQSFVFAYESMLASQLEEPDLLQRVLLYCQSTTGLLMKELQKLANENLFTKAVVAVSNMVCGLYNRHLYDQAFTIVEILCKDLCQKHAVSLSVDRLNRPFMLAVQTSRRAGQLDRALQWVILWLKALGDNITTHMSEPVSLWVKTKTDAVNNSDEDIRLRTLRDGFGADVPDEQIMLCLLEEELRTYKELPRDTAQERYNTLCDLLDICNEESSHSHRRALYLCEMAQVVCFQDFGEHTDCAAVDFTREALRLLGDEVETPENSDRLKDDKAHAELWLFICSLEKHLQEAMENERKQRELREQTPGVNSHIGNNDFDFEEKQKMHDSSLVYEGLHFNLAAEKKLCQPLERALEMWSGLIQSGAQPSVRNAKQTCSSVAVAAALFRLMGKPLKALEAYQCAVEFYRGSADAVGCASALCQSVSILLDLGSPQLALSQLEEAEKMLASIPSEGPSSISMLVILLKAQYFYSTGQVDHGVPRLCEVLKVVSDVKQSKKWYLLRAQTLQLCSSYLNLDTAQLPQTQRSLITQHGISTPDTAVYEGLKLLCSLLITLVGKGLYGANGSSSDVRFIHQGDNLLLKWQLLSELLGCSRKMVALRSSCGAVSDARLQCLEALKLAIKLQALSQCAELLVIKAELELMHEEREECRTDLDLVKNLLEQCTDITAQVQRTDVKIKPRKGRPARRPQSPLPNTEDDLKNILSTRWMSKDAVVEDSANSPPFKALPHSWLSSLGHEAGCGCPCCSQPSLGRCTARWAAAQADLVLKQDPTDERVGFKLHLTTLSRCKSVTNQLKKSLSELFPSRLRAKDDFKPLLMQDVMSRVYLSMAHARLGMRHNKSCGLWQILEAGLTFIDSLPSPALSAVKAGILGTKAIASLMILAAQNNRNPEELCSSVWTWNSPKPCQDAKAKEQKGVSSATGKRQTETGKNSAVPDRKKEPRKVKVLKPIIHVTSSSYKEKSLLPMTPVMTMSKSSTGDLGSFDFNAVVPTLTCTPIQRVKCPPSGQKGSRTCPKLHFHVFEESSPLQEKVPAVPAAPKRTKKSRFKVEFSDESDSEAKMEKEDKEKGKLPRKRNTRKTGPKPKAAPEPTVETIPPRRQAQKKRSTATSCATSSEDEVRLRLPASTRPGRTRKQPSKNVEEPDVMRTIKEEMNEVLNMSIEQLRTSDTETEASSQDVDFEVLRRDVCCNLEREFCGVRSRGHLREEFQLHVSHTDNKPAHLSLEDVQSLLRSAWLATQHFPCPTIYPTLCGLLALTMGQQDPLTTAMLHAQSLGVTSRHRTLRHLFSSLQRLKKASNELTEKMDSLSLDEGSGTVSTHPAEHKLSLMERLFSFPTVDPPSFPQKHCQDLTDQIQSLPPGVTVCLISVVGVKTLELENSVILTRLEKGSAPVTLHISTSKQQIKIHQLLQEMDSILAEQKVVSCVAEKALWWEGRRALDSRVEHLLKEMEEVLGCWKSFLLPLTKDPKLSIQAQLVCRALSARGVTVGVEMLKAVLSAAPVLSEEDLKRFTLGLSPKWDKECDHLLQSAISQLLEREEPKGHVVLILDKFLQKLPWEGMSILKTQSVSRMPSLHSLLGLNIQKDADSQSVLSSGVNPRKVFYVLDPDANLKNAQDRFKDWFCSKPDWQGVCGVPPDSGQLEEAVAIKDLYIYVGHGAGARFLDSHSVLKQRMRAASLLFGCSSAALAVRGNQEGQGILLNYLIAGCPFILGNLWDVTDRDIDRFTKALLESWLSAGSGASILEFMASSRQATNLKYLIGAAPVVYGLPVHLQ
ncbi:separin [Oryzias latipes]|uniref:separase n=2 Tax=Oryzias latipes TaxID=8090 RepID=H2L8K9_ORYLA|nr:separin [Oryzias latipes]